MDVLMMTVALALPVLLGGLWLGLVVPAAVPARPALVWGNGALVGLLALPVLMRVQDAAGAGLNFPGPATICALLIAVALIFCFTRGTRVASTAPARALHRASSSERLLWYFLLALVLLRVVTLSMEVYWRPLFPWDAAMHWATKARVWFEHGSMEPFVDNRTWLVAGGAGVFTDRHPDYPATIPLLQVWMNLALGKWNESIMNMPWPVCLAGLGAAFYGQLRHARVRPVVAGAFTYLLLSMPLVNTHVALAGYADLFLGATYCAALMALHNWIHERQWWQAILVLAFAVFCPLIKNEGFIWAATLIPAVAVAFLRRREAAKFYLLLGLMAILLLLLLPQDLVIAGFTPKQLAPSFNPDALRGVITSMWLHDNWHLFGYMLLVLLPLGILTPGAITRKFLGISVALGSAVAALLFLFLLTGYSLGAVNLAAVGRLTIQLTPGLMFLCALLFSDLLQRQQPAD